MPCGRPPSFSSVSRRSQCTSSSNTISLRDLARCQSTAHAAAAASRSPAGPLAVSSSQYVQSSKRLRFLVHNFLFFFVQSPIHIASCKSHPICCLLDLKDFLAPPSHPHHRNCIFTIQIRILLNSFYTAIAFYLLAVFLCFLGFDMTVVIQETLACASSSTR